MVKAFDPPYVLKAHKVKDYRSKDMTGLSHNGRFLWLEDDAGSAIALIWSLLPEDTEANGKRLRIASNFHKPMRDIITELTAWDAFGLGTGSLSSLEAIVAKAIKLDRLIRKAETSGK